MLCNRTVKLLWKAVEILNVEYLSNFFVSVEIHLCEILTNVSLAKRFNSVLDRLKCVVDMTQWHTLLVVSRKIMKYSFLFLSLYWDRGRHRNTSVVSKDTIACRQHENRVNILALIADGIDILCLTGVKPLHICHLTKLNQKGLNF